MDVYPLSPAPVSVLTELLPFTDLSGVIPVLNVSKFGFALDSFLLIVDNVDPTNTVTVTFETSEDGVSVDTATVYSYTIAPGQQATLEIGPEFTRTYFSISAETQGPSWPTANVNWGVRGNLVNPGTFYR